MKQIAVEWYEKEINSLFEKYEAKEISQREFITMKHNLFYQAKKMEKKQQGYNEKVFKETAERYYKENIDESNIPREHYEWEIQDLMIGFAYKREQQTIEEVFEWLTINNYLTDLKETLIENFKNK
jgi:hypothetical protein